MLDTTTAMSSQNQVQNMVPPNLFNVAMPTSQVPSQSPISSPPLTFFAPEPENQPEGAMEPKSCQENEDEQLPTNYDKFKNMVQCIVISLSGLPLGWDVGTMGQLSRHATFQETFGQSNMSNPLILGTIISVLNLGCLAGASILGSQAQKIGFKIGLYIGIVLYLLGTIIEVISLIDKTHWVWYCVGRFHCGSAIGAFGVIGPVYIGRVVKYPSLKKLAISTHQIACCFGILLGNIVFLCSHESPLLPFGLTLVKFLFAILLSCSLFCVQENRPHQINSGSIDKSPNIYYQIHSTFPYISFEVRFYIKLKCCLVMFFQQFTGINFFFYYSAIIFGSSSLLAGCILSGVNCGSSFFSGLVLEYFGTRQSLIVGSFTMAVCMITFGIIGAVPKSSITVFIMISDIALYIVQFSLTWGPGSSVLVYEISSTSSSMAAAVCANWASNFIVSITTPVLSDLIGTHLGFVFALFLVLGAAVVAYLR